jgi:hypothetical protein
MLYPVELQAYTVSNKSECIIRVKGAGNVNEEIDNTA